MKSRALRIRVFLKANEPNRLVQGCPVSGLTIYTQFFASRVPHILAEVSLR